MNAPASSAEIKDPNEHQAKPALRKKLLRGVFVVLLLAALSYGLYWWLELSHYESTDDAYVGSDMVYVHAQLPGTVMNLAVSDNQSVTAGQLLLTLDPADHRVALAEAAARLADAVRQTRLQFDGVVEAQAWLKQRATEVQRARGDLARRKKLAGTEAMSSEELEHARLALQAAEAALAVAQKQADKAMTSIAGIQVTTAPNVLRARAAYVQAALALQRGEIVAPVAGVVSKRSVQLGQRVAPGASLLAIVPIESAWVDANFKETQLRHLQVGMRAAIETDVYGSSVSYRGTVASVAAGTGSAFSLLPPQNATGNWIKVVQRIPVRIALDPQELRAHPLRVGMSANVKVDLNTGPVQTPPSSSSTTTRTGAAPGYAVKSMPVFAQQLDQAQQQADAIIQRENQALSP